MGVMYNSKDINRPDFIVPVYPWTYAIPVQEAPQNAPPMLVICASDDPLQLAPGSVKLYESWLIKGYKTGLHMYSKGGHGFGMKKQGLPSDHWIERFYEWSVAEGITMPH
jgi:acetyl esterase/lipase